MMILQFLKHRDEMPQVPPEAVEPPADEHIEPPPLGVPDQIIERRSALLRAADALIDVFAADRPPPRLDVSPQLHQLVFAVLIRRAHTSV